MEDNDGRAMPNHRTRDGYAGQVRTFTSSGSCEWCRPRSGCYIQILVCLDPQRATLIASSECVSRVYQCLACLERTHRSPLASLRDPAFVRVVLIVCYIQSAVYARALQTGTAATERVSDVGTREISPLRARTALVSTREASRDHHESFLCGIVDHAHWNSSQLRAEATG